MKKLLFALSAVVALMLTSCLGKTATPGEAAPQGNAADDAQALVMQFDSLLKAGDGDAFYGILANVPEKLLEFNDYNKGKAYLEELQSFLDNNKEKIAGLISNMSNRQAAGDLSKLVSSLGQKTADEWLLACGIEKPAETDVAENSVEDIGNDTDRN